MKRLLTSASFAALGVVGLQAAVDSDLSPTQTSKPWSISAALRGFYDDNYTTLPANRTDGGPTARSSFGFDFSPHVGVNHQMGSTLMTADYTYGLRYYEDRKNNSADHSHQVSAGLQHGFSENYKISLNDSFVVAQEPEVLDPSHFGTGLRLRANGNNMRNSAVAKFDAQLTRLFGAEASYVNNVWAYDQKGFVNSYASLLDRMEHLATLDTRWNVFESTVALLGYQYGRVDYTSPDKGGDGLNATSVGPARYRNNESHYIYAGAKQSFTTQLVGAVRAGAQYTQYPNSGLYKNPASLTDTLRGNSTIPYVDAYLSYNYTTGSQVLAGVRHSRVATDVLALDEEATTVYAALTHQITAKLIGTLQGNFQHGNFEQNAIFNGTREDFWSLGFNLAYQINQYLAAEAGYNLDRLDSGVLNRSFTRNRVYLGVRASY